LSLYTIPPNSRRQHTKRAVSTSIATREEEGNGQLSRLAMRREEEVMQRREFKGELQELVII
jgi:hypothetical protein